MFTISFPPAEECLVMAGSYFVVVVVSSVFFSQTACVSRRETLYAWLSN